MRSNTTDTMPEQELCVGCGVELHGSRRDRRYCSSVCRQRAYRQRVRLRRDKHAVHAETQAIVRQHDQHRRHWVEWFVRDAGLSRKQADRLYVRLIESGRLPSPGQMTIDQYLRTPAHRRRQD